MNFYFSLKVIKEREETSKFKEKTTKMLHQSMENKQLKQIATIKNN